MARERYFRTLFINVNIMSINDVFESNDNHDATKKAELHELVGTKRR